LFLLLATMPDVDAVEVLRRIRSGLAVENVLQQIESANLLLQMSLDPVKEYFYKLPYAPSAPSRFRDPQDPYRILFEIGSTFTRDQFHSTINQHSQVVKPHPMFLVPYHAAELIEPRLKQVRASTWTTVISDDQLMSRLLSSFFQFEFPPFQFFHKDLFLDDLVSGRTRFCSSLLVNAILACACVSVISRKSRDLLISLYSTVTAASTTEQSSGVLLTLPIVSRRKLEGSSNSSPARVN